MVSLKDIADKCSVSIATVSKALNDHDDIGPDTKKNIREIAEKLGYFPNSSARALKTKRTNNIGVLFVDEGRSGLTHDYFARVLDSFKRVTEVSGYDITFINATSQKMTYLEHAHFRGVDGVVIACVDFDDRDVIDLINSDLPVVTIDHVFDNRISVVSDNIGGMHDLIKYVHSLGHERIGYIYGDDTAVTRNRVASYYNTLKELGITADDSLLCASAYRNPKLAAKYTEQLLAQRNRPTCILYPDDYSAIGGLNAIEKAGLSVPNDISVAGYDGLYVSQIIHPKLTTYQQNSEEIGRIAAKSLIRLIRDPKSTLIDKILVPGKVLEGASVRDIK
ncbi:MAG: LacI family transcriptional regulator [Lachnospiraceae bacterium]|jgi:DNA-binding LacI/PurR family transcriptional regulator|nr:LacI family transcriptional regulator [Lachnospiraceae bacterium]